MTEMSPNLGALASPDPAISPTTDQWPRQASQTPPFEESLKSSIDRFSASFMRRLGAEGAAVLWRDGLQGRTTCLATSGTSQPGEDLGILDAEHHGAHANRAAHWHWQSGRDSEADWLCIDFSVASGLISIVATIASKVGKRELIERALPKLVKETVPFFEVCGIAFRALGLAANLKSASNALDAGIVVIDCDGDVLFANDAAEVLSLDSGAFRMTGGTLRANTLRDSLRLQTTVDHVIRGSARRSNPHAASVVALNRPEGRPLMVAVHPIEPSAWGDEQAAAVLYFSDPERNPSAAIQPICDFYRLSGVEAKLAHLLVRGLSVAESAGHLKLKEQTARSYLKQIFLKTETKRQGELVSVLLRGAIASTPDRNTHFLTTR